MIVGYKKILKNGNEIKLEGPETGYVKVDYICDEPTCINKNIVYTSTYHSMKHLDKWNNLERQMCKSCRTRKSEKDVKNIMITYEQIVEELKNENYKIITTKEDFESSLRPSTTKLNVICSNGHTHQIFWNNWKNKNRRCRKCYEENRYDEAVQYKDGFKEYEFNIDHETRKTYNKYKKEIDPENKRSRLYHLDHKYSVYQGFIDNIDPVIMSSRYNLELIPVYDNISKNNKCSITMEALLNVYYGKN